MGETHTLPSFHISNLFIGQPSLEEKGEACSLVGWDVKNSHVKSLYSRSASHIREGRMSVDGFCTGRLNLASPSLHADPRAFENRGRLTKIELP